MPYRQGIGDAKAQQHSDGDGSHIEVELGKGHHIKPCHQRCQATKGTQLFSMAFLQSEVCSVTVHL